MTLRALVMNQLSMVDFLVLNMGPYEKIHSTLMGDMVAVEGKHGKRDRRKKTWG